MKKVQSLVLGRQGESDMHHETMRRGAENVGLSVVLHQRIGPKQANREGTG